MGRAGVNTIWLVVLCQLTHGLTFTALPLPLVRADLGISFTQAGMLSAVATLSYVLGQIPAGFIADRYGLRRPFFVGLLGWSALSLYFGLIHVFWLALVSQFVAGALRALMFAPGLTLLASWFPPQRRATAMSLYMVGGFAGNIVLALAGPLLFAVIALSSVFLQFYFGPLFLVPVEVLGPRIAGTATGVGNLFANIGGFLTTYAFGVVKDHAGSFAWGYRAIGVVCIAGVALSVVLARARRRCRTYAMVLTWGAGVISISPSSITSRGVNPGATSSRTNRPSCQCRSARSVTT